MWAGGVTQSDVLTEVTGYHDIDFETCLAQLRECLALAHGDRAVTATKSKYDARHATCLKPKLTALSAGKLGEQPIERGGHDTVTISSTGSALSGLFGCIKR